MLKSVFSSLLVFTLNLHVYPVSDFVCNFFFLNLSFSDFCDFESEPETSCFLTEELSNDNGDWTRGTVSMPDWILNNIHKSR